MFLDLYSNGEPHEASVEFMTSHNGMIWWRDLPQVDRLAMVKAFQSLPIAIEIETKRGPVGLVHAEVPAGMTWQTFTQCIEAGDKEVIEQAVWGRNRIRHGDDHGVPGIGRVFVGHTPIKHAHRLGNVYYIDTGAVFGVLGDAPAKGRLTIADLACKTQEFTRAEIDGMVDLRFSEEAASTPFGSYVKP